MKPEAFIDRESSENLIHRAKENRAKYMRDMFSSYNSKKVAQAVGFVGLTFLTAIGFAAWHWAHVRLS